MSNVAGELRFAFRLLRRSPGFAILGILTLAVAIGACTAVFSVVHGVLLKPLPYPAPDALVQVWQVSRAGARTQFSEPNFDDLRARTRSFEAMAEFASGTDSVVAGTEPLRADVATVSRDFFAVFATPPMPGRAFNADELREGAPRAAVISHRFWQQRFGGRPDLAELRLRVGGRPHTVVGVAASGFDFPAGAAIWVPLEATTPNPYRTGHNWQVVGRIADGVRLETARVDATTVARAMAAEYGQATWMADAALVPLRDQLVGTVRPVLLLLLAAVALLLIVGCANLANLLIVRVTARRRELAVRSALGATGRSLLWPLTAESLVLAAVGGALGIGLAYISVRSLALLDGSAVRRLDEVGPSWPVLLFALAVTAATACALGALAAWRASRPDLVGGLKDSSRSVTGSASAGRLRYGLVVAQLALAVVLLVGAGLLGRSLLRLLHQDPGFRTDGVLTIDLSSPPPDIKMTPQGIELGDPAVVPRQVQVHERLIRELGTLPGVTAAGGINRFPLGSAYSNGTFILVRGNEPQTLDMLGRVMNDPERTGDAEFRVATAGYFRVMGIPLLRGRLFESTDGPEQPHVAVISASLARSKWPDQDPIGARVQFGGMDGDLRVFTIVGVVDDIRERGLDAQPRPTFYADYRQRPLTAFDFTIVLQTAVVPTSLVSDARRIIREAMPEVAPRFRSIEQVVGASIAGRRFTLALTLVFAGAALLLSVLGVYGVLSYLVAQRTQEFGVRMALGARQADVLSLVLGEAARPIAIGLALGVVASLLFRRVLDGVLFGITSTDPLTYVAVIGLLGTAAFAACQLPAIRATRVDPLRALRTD